MTDIYLSIGVDMFENQKIESVSKADIIERLILAKIQSGELRPDEQLPSEIVLAQKFAAHRLTVNKALSSLVRRGALRRVHGCGTFVNSPEVAQAKSNTGIKTVYIFFIGDSNGASNEYFYKSYHALCAYLSGFSVMIKTEICEDFEACERFLDLRKGIIDCVAIFTFENISSDCVAIFQKHRISFVLFNRSVDARTDIPCVLADNVAATQAITKVLLDDGHDRILYIRFDVETSVARDRMVGYRTAMGKAEHFNDRLIINAGGWMEREGYIALQSAYQQGLAFTAVICEGARLALGAKSYIDQHRHAVAQEVVLACLDNWGGGIPGFTYAVDYAIEFPLRDMGVATGAMLLDIMNGNKIESVRREFSGQVICSKELYREGSAI